MSDDTIALAKRAWSWLDTERDWTTDSGLDPQAYFDLLADDVVLEVDSPDDSYVFGSAITGKPAVIDMYRQAPEWIEDNRLERPLEFVGGDRVVVLGAERYTIKKSGAVARNKEFAIVTDFRDGLITRVRQIGDMSEWVDAYRNSNVELARKAYSDLDDKRGGRSEADFQPYIDLLAEDVVFQYAAPDGTPVSGEFHGKQAVVEFMTVTSPELVEDIRLEGELEYFGRGDRVVVLGAESYTIRKTGVSVRNKQFAVVMDFREGLISRVLQIKDLSDVVAAFRAS